jgi:hypothetical protein
MSMLVMLKELDVLIAFFLVCLSDHSGCLLPDLVLMFKGLDGLTPDTLFFTHVDK